MSEPQPFIGLEPFSEAQRDRFFGRNRETRLLAHKIRANKLTVLVTASGVGKSSLLEAGVKPALREQGQQVLLTFRRWAGDPLPELKQTLADDLAGRGKLEAGANLGRRRSLAMLLRVYCMIGGVPLTLILDQFEELFTYHRLTDRLDPLVCELAEAIRDGDAQTRFVLSMREDFAMELNACKPHLPRILDNYYRLEKLNTEHARHAIEQPVLDVGWRYETLDGEHTLADELLQDLAHREQRDRLGAQRMMTLGNPAAAGRAAACADRL